MSVVTVVKAFPAGCLPCCPPPPPPGCVLCGVAYPLTRDPTTETSPAGTPTLALTWSGTLCVGEFYNTRPAPPGSGYVDPFFGLTVSYGISYAPPDAPSLGSMTLNVNCDSAGLRLRLYTDAFFRCSYGDITHDNDANNGHPPVVAQAAVCDAGGFVSQTFTCDFQEGLGVLTMVLVAI